MYPVIEDNQLFYIDKKGNIILETDFQGGWTFQEDRAKVFRNKQVGFINKVGELVVDIKYDMADQFHEGVCRVQTGGKWGFIDINGDVVIEPIYDKASNFSEGLAGVQKEKFYKTQYIDRSHNIIIKDSGDDVVINDFSEGLVPSENRKTRLSGYRNTSGKWQIKASFEKGWRFSEGFAGVRTKKNKKEQLGLIDKTGNIVLEIPSKYWEYPIVVTNGLIAVYHKGEMGCINTKGEVVIPFEFYHIDLFSEGLALACRNKNEKYGYINTEGDFVIPQVFENISMSFENGLTRAWTEERVYILDLKGNIIWPKGAAYPSYKAPVKKDTVDIDGVYAALDDRVQANKIDNARSLLKRRLKKTNYRKFDTALSLRFTNKPGDINRSIDLFIAQCQKKFDLKAIYLEMNGFYINPDLWYFDYFGYDYYESDANLLDWLSDCNSKDFPSTTLAGFETLQDLYGDDELEFELVENKEASLAKELCDFWVLLSFMKLIDKAAKARKKKHGIPLLCTAHDYDLIYRSMI